MENNNPYGETLKWYPESRNPAYQRQMPYEYVPYAVDVSTQWTPQAATEKLRPKSTSRKQARMPKAEALSLASKLKKTAIIASITAFGIISGLVVTHLQTASASQATPSSSSPGISSPSNPSSPPNSANPSDPSNSGSYFGQQGGGYGFGNGGSAMPPSTGSGVS